MGSNNYRFAPKGCCAPPHEIHPTDTITTSASPNIRRKPAVKKPEEVEEEGGTQGNGPAGWYQLWGWRAGGFGDVQEDAWVFLLDGS